MGNNKSKSLLDRILFQKSSSCCNVQFEEITEDEIDLAGKETVEPSENIKEGKENANNSKKKKSGGCC